MRPKVCERDSDALVGQRVTAIRPMTPGELAREGWGALHHWQIPCVIEFSDGTIAIPATSADETRQPAVFLGVDRFGAIFQVRAVPPEPLRPPKPSRQAARPYHPRRRKGAARG
jgi:hypothetical protein